MKKIKDLPSWLLTSQKRLFFLLSLTYFITIIVIAFLSYERGYYDGSMAVTELYNNINETIINYAVLS